MPSSHRKRSPGLTNARGFSAAAFSGIIGLPEQGRGPRLYDGGLAAFSRTFNRRFDELAATTRPEWRSFARAEREIRCI